MHVPANSLQMLIITPQIITITLLLVCALSSVVIVSDLKRHDWS